MYPVVKGQRMEPKMESYKKPTGDEQRRFALELYFGRGEALDCAISRAYRDFCRAAPGIGKHEDAKDESTNAIKEAINSLCKKDGQITQKEFNHWHESLCDKLCERFKKSDYKFHIGQAQKWINMTFKYLYVYGESLAPGYEYLFKYCHVPIDNVILNRTKKFELRNFKCAWSKIPDYDTYLSFQEGFRKHFQDSPPLAVEFWLWRNESGSEDVLVTPMFDM